MKKWISRIRTTIIVVMSLPLIIWIALLLFFKGYAGCELGASPTACIVFGDDYGTFYATWGKILPLIFVIEFLPIGVLLIIVTTIIGAIRQRRDHKSPQNEK